MTIDGPALIAIKSQSGGWLNTDSKFGESKNLTTGAPVYPTWSTIRYNRLPHQGTDTEVAAENKNGPPRPNGTNRYYYAPLWEFSAEVQREYGGINSSGGPQVTGRADQSDFKVQWQTNSASPVLYEHCCSGKQLEWVHVVVAKWDNDIPSNFLHIRMQGVNVTGFEMNAVRWFADETRPVEGGLTFNGATVLEHKPSTSMYGVGHYDDFTLLYTKIAFKHQSNTEKTWDTGADAAWSPVA